PVTVVVNNIAILITTENDYQLVENAFEEFSNDDDILQIVFPIEIILMDYTQVAIENFSTFNNFVSECAGENEPDEDIECIDFIYPIQFEVLAFNATISNTITIANDKELFQFIDNLDDFIAVNFNFPFSLIKFDGIEVDVNDIESLETNLENAISDCDEDDDYDFDDDDEIILAGFLTDGNWIIDEYVFADEDFTEDYNGYVFNFDDSNSSMNMSANNGVELVTGNWSIDTTDPSNLLVVLDFDSITPFNDLNENWNIIESEVDRLALEIGSEINGDLKILVFEKL
ncbi:MAG: hypothetical protein IIC74_01615, partial [Bacteroidetes bacterium]|nr:hypothetical protein [Bacteroidota bacterium]